MKKTNSIETKMAVMNDKHWLQSFVEKNLWQILLLVGGVVILYSSIVNKVSANDDRISKLESAIIGISDNQTQILLIQQQQANTNSAIIEIKVDIKEIKLKLETLR